MISGAFANSPQKFLKPFKLRTHGRDEEVRLSSGWISIGSELSSLNFNSSVRAEQSRPKLKDALLNRAFQSRF